jgi:hypothetical protein
MFRFLRSQELASLLVDAECFRTLLDVHPMTMMLFHRRIMEFTVILSW